VKGIVEALCQALDPAAELIARPTSQPLLDAEKSCGLRLSCGNQQDLLLGYLGEVSASGLKTFELRGATTVAELRFSTLLQIARLVPCYAPLSVYPAVERDLNFVVEEAVLWADVARAVRTAASPLAEGLAFVDVYRDEARLGKNRKSLLMKLILRSRDGTLTSEQADAACQRAIAAVRDQHGGELRA
jgi:phenylalanyl-tRNA synthetase beta chain